MREQGVTPMQRASLTQQIQDVFDLLTTPDYQDVYPRYADVQKLIPSRSRDIPNDLCGALANAQWVETLNTQIGLALNGDRNRFTADEVRLLEELHRRVQRGEPIRSQSQTGPAWTAIAKQINIASYKGLAVSRKLRGLYGALG